MTAFSLQDDGLDARRFHHGDVGGEAGPPGVSPTFFSPIKLSTQSGFGERMFSCSGFCHVSTWLLCVTAWLARFAARAGRQASRFHQRMGEVARACAAACGRGGLACPFLPLPRGQDYYTRLSDCNFD